MGAGFLGLPEPPASLSASIEQLGDHRWGTRRGTPALRGLGWFESEFLEGRRPGDYVLAGRVDAATNPGAIQYLVVCGRLGLFLSVGVDERGRRALGRVAELQDAALPALDDGPLRVDGRLCVLHDEFGTSRWAWTGVGAIGGVDGVTGALEWLRGLRRSGS